MKYTADRSRISQLVAAEMSYFGSKYALPIVAGSTALVSMVALLFSMFFYAGQIGSGQNYIYLVISASALAAFFALYAVYRMKSSREGMQYDNVLIFTAECFVISGFAGLVILRTSWMWQLIEISPGQFNRYLKTISLFAVMVPLAVAAIYAVFTFVNTDRPLPYMGWLYKVYTFVPFSVLLFVHLSTGASSEERAINVVTVTSAVYISLILGFTAHFVAKLLMLKYLEETPARYETFIKVKHAKTASASPSEAYPAPVASREDFVSSFTPDIEPETMMEKVAAYAEEAKASAEKAKTLKDRIGGLASGVAGLFGSKKSRNNDKASAGTVGETDDIETAAAVGALVEPEPLTGSELEAEVAKAAADAAEPEDDSAERAEQERLAAEAEELERRETERKAAEAAREAERRAAEAEELARIAEEAERDREAMLALEIAEQKRREELAAAPAVEHKAAVIEQAPVLPGEDEETEPRRESGMARLRNSIKGLLDDLRTPLDGLYLEGGAAESEKSEQTQKTEEYAEAPLAELGGEFVIGTGLEGAEALERPAESAAGEKPRVGQFFESHRKRVKGVPDEQMKGDYTAPAKKLAPGKPSIFERILSFFKGAAKSENATQEENAAARALERLRAMADEKARLDGLYESYARLARGGADRLSEEWAEPQTDEESTSNALERLTAMVREKEALDSAAPSVAAATEAEQPLSQPETPAEPEGLKEAASGEADETTLAESGAAKEDEAEPEPHISALERLTAMTVDRAADSAAEGAGSAETAYQPAESDSALARLLAIKNRAERQAEEAPAPPTVENAPDTQAETEAAHGLFESPFEGAQADYEPAESELELEAAVSALTEPQTASETERESTDELIKTETARGTEGALERLAAIAARRGVPIGEITPTASDAASEAKTNESAEPETVEISKTEEAPAESAAETADAAQSEPAEPRTEPDIIEQLDDEAEPERESDPAERQPDEPLTEVMDDDFAKLRSYDGAQEDAEGSDDASSEPEGGESAEKSEHDERDAESAKRAPIRAQVVRRSTVRPHSRRKPPHRH